MNNPVAQPTPGSDTEHFTEMEKLATVVLKVTNADPNLIRLGKDPIWNALMTANVTSLGGLYALTSEQVTNLEYQQYYQVTTRTGVIRNKVRTAKLSPIYCQQLKMIIACFHDFSYMDKKPFPMEEIEADVYDDWRVRGFNPEAETKPWYVRIEDDKKSKQKDETVLNWKKVVRPSTSYFKEFRDTVHWPQWLQKVKTACKATDLGHLLDKDYVPENEELDELQSSWFYKVLEDKILEPTGRSIVLEYQDKPEKSRECWQRLVEEYSTSLSAETASKKYVRYITSADIANWKGTQLSFLHHLEKQIRDYRTVTPVAEQFTNDQLRRFLEQSIHGADNLAIIKNTFTTTRLASGKKVRIRYEQLLDMLKEQATVYDDGHKKGGDSKRYENRSAKFHEFDDMDSDGDTGSLDDSGDEWNVDTDIDTILAYQMNSYQPNKKKPFSKNSSSSNQSNSSGPRKAWMNGETWRKLNANDQRAWDSLSDTAKKEIHDYLTKRGQAMSKDPQNYNNTNRAINSHDAIDEEHLIFDDDEPEVSVNKSDTKNSKNTSSKSSSSTTKNRKVEANSHIALPKDDQRVTTSNNNKSNLPLPLELNMTRVLSSDRNAPSNCEANTAMTTREVHMRRAFRNLQEDLEDESDDDGVSPSISDRKLRSPTSKDTSTSIDDLIEIASSDARIGIYNWMEIRQARQKLTQMGVNYRSDPTYVPTRQTVYKQPVKPGSYDAPPPDTTTKSQQRRSPRKGPTTTISTESLDMVSQFSNMTLKDSTPPKASPPQSITGPQRPKTVVKSDITPKRLPTPNQVTKPFVRAGNFMFERSDIALVISPDLFISLPKEAKEMTLKNLISSYRKGDLPLSHYGWYKPQPLPDVPSSNVTSTHIPTPDLKKPATSTELVPYAKPDTEYSTTQVNATQSAPGLTSVTVTPKSAKKVTIRLTRPKSDPDDVTQLPPDPAVARSAIQSVISAYNENTTKSVTDPRAQDDTVGVLKSSVESINPSRASHNSNTDTQDFLADVKSVVAESQQYHNSSDVTFIPQTLDAKDGYAEVDVDASDESVHSGEESDDEEQPPPLQDADIDDDEEILDVPTDNQDVSALIQSGRDVIDSVLSNTEIHKSKLPQTPTQDTSTTMTSASVPTDNQDGSSGPSVHDTDSSYHPSTSDDSSPTDTDWKTPTTTRRRTKRNKKQPPNETGFLSAVKSFSKGACSVVSSPFGYGPHVSPEDSQKSGSTPSPTTNRYAALQDFADVHDDDNAPNPTPTPTKSGNSTLTGYLHNDAEIVLDDLEDIDIGDSTTPTAPTASETGELPDDTAQGEPSSTSDVKSTLAEGETNPTSESTSQNFHQNSNDSSDFRQGES